MFCQLRSMWIGCHVAPVEPGTIANRVQFWDHCLRFNRCGGALWQVAGIRRLGLISVTGSSGAASGADRLPPPGHGNQALHCDNQTSAVVLNYGACNSLWMLDDSPRQRCHASGAGNPPAAGAAARSSGRAPGSDIGPRPGRHGDRFKWHHLARRHRQPHQPAASNHPLFLAGAPD